ncbi:MAG: nitroreductase family protein [Candidatus Adiutrix sp.]|jgi:nitroreductase|nr:nitroreductase family protein [Candidatus Adiutrix sp.]
MEYHKLIKARYSVRKFSPRPVEDEKIQTILEAARPAPTAVDKQPYRLLILKGTDSVAKLKDCTPYAFDAPMAILVCGCPDEAWVRPYDGQNAVFIDAAIIGTHLMLAIHDLGLGATWVGHFDPAAIRQAYNLPATLEPVALFPFGYPADDAKPAPLHEKRRPLAEMVFYDRF